MTSTSWLPKSERSAVEPVDHGVMAGDEKLQRKRTQNRLNQRARKPGLRLRDKDQAHITANPRPFRVYRWRLEDESQTTSGASSKHLNHGPAPNNTEWSEHSAPYLSVAPFSISNQVQRVLHGSSETEVSLPADHLLHLIQFNVLRGVHHAKVILAGSSAFIIPGIEKNEIRPGHLWFLGTSMYYATRPGLPESLIPTSLQMDIEHATWINFLPIPRMRDNLIAHENSFDHTEFVRDLLGDKIVDYMFGSLWSRKPPIASKLALTEGDDDDVTASRQGLILWGEPHRLESWEVTPGFIRKWAWAMEGCDELIASSNRWRMMRGEEPIRVTVCE
ncbi:hypothetical protein F9C07_1840 [Aspergillus flavus]|uniref:BZIP domain-containing protein n=1 Tax=Aspergillus flavus (strain ATCC 200026 / FGSC A1120 / IAM 13836 / NRRL 3357 / JCM 12722 / SRRC 167) TaxID=332952 RepID=A0A7U2QUE3_ASPFN|nr:uncharacterized protein G4B84_003990 [Aspergillus flavus NRRL3357]QMW28701.1 hypothetical protein G4B84_003990 [Aspergillus flavus NRRL3357]QRD83230.1 hypothetical protein F9C07_1840 [Aspergillus flavus]